MRIAVPMEVYVSENEHLEFTVHASPGIMIVIDTVFPAL